MTIPFVNIPANWRMPLWWGEVDPSRAGTPTFLQPALLTDPTFVSLGADALFESVERVTRRRLFPKDGEAYFAEVRIEFTFLHRVVFEPVVDDDYAGATVTAKPLGFDADAPYTKFTIDPPAT